MKHPLSPDSKPSQAGQPASRPMIFSGPMVRAILEGRKTQTRRVVTVPWHKGKLCLPYEPYYVEEDRKLLYMDEAGDYHPMEELCPYGQPSQRLWVRESFFIWCPIHNGGAESTVAKCLCHSKVDEYRADSKRADHPIWRPSIHMPRWASRITLEIVSVRVERLNEMSVDDAIAEGINGVEYCPTREHEACRFEPVLHYINLWNSINGKKHPFESNPWVWVIEFRRLP